MFIFHVIEYLFIDAVIFRLGFKAQQNLCAHKRATLFASSKYVQLISNDVEN